MPGGVCFVCFDFAQLLLSGLSSALISELISGLSDREARAGSLLSRLL
jgi:hypothetical protein